MKISLRTKLIISFLAVIIICGLVSTLVGRQLIVNGIITRHKGSIRVKSDPGKGTAFIIRLPLKRRDD